jgi:hypothetical protein
MPSFPLISAFMSLEQLTSFEELLRALEGFPLSITRMVLSPGKAPLTTPMPQSFATVAVEPYATYSVVTLSLCSEGMEVVLPIATDLSDGDSVVARAPHFLLAPSVLTITIGTERGTNVILIALPDDPAIAEAARSFARAIDGAVAPAPTRPTSSASCPAPSVPTTPTDTSKAAALAAAMQGTIVELTPLGHKVEKGQRGQLFQAYQALRKRLRTSLGNPSEVAETMTRVEAGDLSDPALEKFPHLTAEIERLQTAVVEAASKCPTETGATTPNRTGTPKAVMSAKAAALDAALREVNVKKHKGGERRSKGVGGQLHQLYNELWNKLLKLGHQADAVTKLMADVKAGVLSDARLQAFPDLVAKIGRLQDAVLSCSSGSAAGAAGDQRAR